MKRPFGAASLIGAALALLLPAVAASDGPDVTVFNFPDVTSYGPQDGFVAYSVGTRSCNRGDTPLNWCDDPSGCAPGATTADHPVIIQNLYRVKSGRFEQIGMAWLKHGFFAENNFSAGCAGGHGETCGGPGPFGSHQLMVGCTDPYVASLYNSARPLGRRSEVDATTGEFPMPYGSQAGPYTAYDQRIKVDVDDVDPAQNAGAVYFAEGHYIAPDDAAAGNALNNASTRQVVVGGAPGFAISMTGDMFEAVPAVVRWQAVDPEVEIAPVDVPASSPVERFHVARKVTRVADTLWHYEYAIHNMNSDRSARLFAVDFPDGTAVTAIGFHDVDSHSGEVYQTADWTSSFDAPSSTVSWSTATYGAGTENANALRFATAYSFWFDADAPPGDSPHLLGLFKPGTPDEVVFALPLFADGFESNGTSRWSDAEP
jgi:hypothetical protein